jgi:DNA-binding CsgD family transcriptional regulator/PAS domain-containing protein
VDLQDRLLPILYATAEDAGQWKPALDLLCAKLTTGSAVVQILERQGDRFKERWTRRDTRSLAHAALHDRFVNNDDNPRLRAEMTSFNPFSIMRDRDRFSGNAEQLVDLRERLARIGLGSAICLSFELSERRCFSLILHRELGDERDYDEATETLLRQLAPHLQQTMRLAATINTRSAKCLAAEQVLDLLRTGVILCDSSGAVRRMNRSAEAILVRSTALRLVGDRLCGTGAGSKSALKRLLDAQADSTKPRLAALSQPDGDLHILSTRLPQDSDDESCVLSGATPERVLLVSDPAAPFELLPNEVAQLFGLSPAESRLAATIAQGGSVSAYSEHRGISVGTARNQLKHVLAKTQASKQTELTRRICSSVLGQAFTANC